MGREEYHITLSPQLKAIVRPKEHHAELQSGETKFRITEAELAILGKDWGRLIKKGEEHFK